MTENLKTELGVARNRLSDWRASPFGTPDLNLRFMAYTYFGAFSGLIGGVIGGAIYYLADGNNNPDTRFNKLIGVIKTRPFLSTKPVEQICSASGITLFPDTSKDDVADFLNYLSVHFLQISPILPLQQRSIDIGTYHL